MNSQKDNRFLHGYISDIIDILNKRKDYLSEILKLKELIIKIKKKNKKIIFAGNGGSAATASHASVDFTKNAKIKSINFNEADLITCFSNDYGYERWVEKAIEFYADKGDALILISASGESNNMLNAINSAKKVGVKTIITFTGNNKNNSLSKLGDINFWIDSKSYNHIENVHQILLLSLVDLIIGKKDYPPN